MATDIERLVVLIEANTKSYERTMQRLQQQTDKAIRGSTKSVASLDRQLKSAAATAKTFATAFGAGALAGGLVAIPGAIRAIVSSVAELGDTSERIGITAEQLQELNFQAEQTGSSAATMADGLSQFAKRLGEARQGSGDLFKLLQANGVALEDLAKMPVNEALRIFIDLLSNAGDEANRLAIATDGFGRGAGAELALTFKGGTQAMGEWAREARAAINIISDFDVQKIRDIDDAWQAWVSTIGAYVKSGIVHELNETAKEIDAIHAAWQSFRGFMESRPFLGDTRPPAGGNLQDLIEDRSSRDRSRPTIIPPPAGGGGGGGGGGGRAGSRDSAAAAAAREKEQVADLIVELEREQKLIGATNLERRISNELHAAGAAATEQDKERIVALVTAMEAEQTALDDLIDRMDTLRDASGSALDAFAQSIQNAQGPLQALKAALVDILQTVVRIAEQRAITSLLGAAGGIGGGILGAGIGRLSGAAVASAGGRSTNVVITAHPSPMLDLHIERRATAAEQRAVARGPAVARNSSQRFGIP